jgi:hypothetical protein
MDIEFAFFHIEKCAGSSLRMMLYEYFQHIYNLRYIYIPERHNVRQNLLSVSDFDILKPAGYKLLFCHCNFNHLGVTDSFSKTCFSITCVREPLARFLSHYYFFGRTRMPFANLTDEQIIPMLKDTSLLTRRLSGNTNSLEIALDNLQHINCILILEKLESDVVSLNKLLNETTGAALKFKMVFKNVHKSFSAEDYARVKQFEQYFASDIQLYSVICSMGDKRFKN